MNRVPEQSYCGPLGIDLANLFSKKTGPTVYDLFEGRDVYYTHKCRTALRKGCDLFNLGVDDEVLIPAYNCGSEIDVFSKAGVSLQPYRITDTSEIDMEDFVGRITKRTRAALVTHYFGFPQAISDIAKICSEKRIYLIEDCAHALLSRVDERMLGSAGDIAVFSFPKTLGVPDGGALVVNTPDISGWNWVMVSPSNKVICTRLLPLLKSTLLEKSSAWPILEQFLLSVIRNRQLGSIESSNQKSGTLPRMPEDYYYDDSNTDRQMSQLTSYLLSKIDVGSVVERRRINYLMLLDILKDREDVRPLFSDLPEGVCPLYFPVLTKNRERVARNLNKRSIRAISWWRGYHNSLPWYEFEAACMLKDSVMALPIHQDISEEQIRYMGRQLIEVLDGEPRR
jgi:perosamine synthetase